MSKAESFPIDKSHAARREFLSSFNYFRGIAILLIVAGHCFQLVTWEPIGIAGETFFNLITGGTSLFVFISGFLFEHVFYKNFNYRKFMLSKFRNVLTPYLFMSIFVIPLALIRKGGAGEFNSYFFAEGQGIWIEYIRPALLYLWTGKAATAYWYIPFAMFIFLLSPLFTAYINSSLKLRNFYMLALFSISMIIHRPIGNLFVIQSIIYFSPVYLLGIQASIHRDFIYEKFKGREIYLISAAIACAVLQSALLDTVGNFQKSALMITVPDIGIIQKCLLCLFFMVFLHRFESTEFSTLNRIAAASFAIFFLHAVLIKVLKFGLAYWAVPTQSLVAWAGLTPLVVLCCYCIASTVKRMLPHSSRMLIGW